MKLVITLRSFAMSLSEDLLAIGTAAALGMALGASTLALAQFSPLMRSFSDNWSSSSDNAFGQLPAMKAFTST